MRTNTKLQGKSKEGQWPYFSHGGYLDAFLKSETKTSMRTKCILLFSSLSFSSSPFGWSALTTGVTHASGSPNRPCLWAPSEAQLQPHPLHQNLWLLLLNEQNNVYINFKLYNPFKEKFLFQAKVVVKMEKKIILERRQVIQWKSVLL